MSRILDTQTDIDTSKVIDFFQDRAGRLEKLDSTVAMLYQDNNPQLALDRHDYETKHLLPLIAADRKDIILDIGCGIGRWADAFKNNVKRYIGIDPIDSFVQTAKEKFKGQKEFSFFTLPAESLTQIPMGQEKFSIFLITGVLHYLNDSQCQLCFSQITDIAQTQSRVVIRVPIGIETRLTLKNIWSEELQYHYSAIYRTADEYKMVFSDTLLKVGFKLTHSHHLYPKALNNRAETCQHIFVLERI